MFEQIPALSPTPEMIIGFILITLGFLVVSTLVVWLVKGREAKFVLLGLVVSVAAIGYASIVSGGAVVIAPMMMRIGFILVLAGIACGLLSSLSRFNSSGANVPVEAADERI